MLSRSCHSGVWAFALIAAGVHLVLLDHGQLQRATSAVDRLKE